MNHPDSPYLIGTKLCLMKGRRQANTPPRKERDTKPTPNPPLGQAHLGFCARLFLLHRPLDHSSPFQQLPNRGVFSDSGKHTDHRSFLKGLLVPHPRWRARLQVARVGGEKETDLPPVAQQQFGKQTPQTLPGKPTEPCHRVVDPLVRPGRVAAKGGDGPPLFDNCRQANEARVPLRGFPHSPFLV